MLKLQKILLILCLTILGACSPHESLKNYSKKEFAKNERAVVFFDIRENKSSLEFILVNADTGKSYELSGSRFNRIIPNRIMFLEPGLYYIQKITLLPSANMMYWLPGPGLKKGVISYGAFWAGAGDVLSMGILTVENNSRLIYKQNYGELYQQLRKSNRSELAPKLKKGEFYNRGSVIQRGDNNRRQIIPAETVSAYREMMLKELKDRIAQESE